MNAQPTFLVRVDNDVHTSVFNEHDEFACPVCGNHDLSTWADDGEADMADWFECQPYGGGCGTNGALVRPDDTTKTLNGVSVGEVAEMREP